MNPDKALEILNQPPFDIIATKQFPAQPGCYAEIPRDLHPEVSTWLSGNFPQGVYSHQAAALECFLRGNNVALMTPTASGKTAVFQAAAAHLLKNGSGKILALFPLVALANDQAASWRLAGERLGIRVGILTGACPVGARCAVLRNSDVVLATPDVIHAWFMSNLHQQDVRRFRSELALLIQDEIHSYDSIFGTNYAYFMHRLRACGPEFKIMSATATLGAPETFLKELTGQDHVVIGKDGHGAQQKAKTVICVRMPVRDDRRLAMAIRQLGNACSGQVLCFLNNRGDTGVMADFTSEFRDAEPHAQWASYRFGFEETDRAAIQAALVQGELKGIFATSALEAGINIGAIEVVVIMGKPAKARSLWQRLGRLRGEREGVCIIIDSDWPNDQADLDSWLSQPVEGNQLYTENPALQLYSATCVVHEQLAIGDGYRMAAFEGCHPDFLEAVHLASNPEETFSERDRLILADANTGAPQYSFALRHLESRYTVEERGNPNRTFGFLTRSQLFQEAFPGAIGRYLGTTYRVEHVDHRNKRVFVRIIGRTPRQTYPTKIVTGFTNFSTDGKILMSDRLLLAQAPLNLREQVIGFTQRNGAASETFVYGSTYKSPPLQRTVPTEGAIIAGPDLCEATVEHLLKLFCSLTSVHPSDLAFSPVRWGFDSKLPLPDSIEKGWCIADRMPGGLRLSYGIIDRWSEVLALAIETARSEQQAQELERLGSLTPDVAPYFGDSIPISPIPTSDSVVPIVAPGSPALCLTDGTEREVVVKEYLYHPKLEAWCYGVTFQFSAPAFVKASTIIGVEGLSRQALFDTEAMKIVPPPSDSEQPDEED